MTAAPLGTAATRRLFVFSHPNHELAVFGIARRLRPHLLFLTDGGGAERVDDTRRALATIALGDHATVLAHSEQSFYDALLRRDVDFFAAVAAEVRRVADAVDAQQIYADAIELYNPVHDVTLPVVAAALRGGREAALFEIPLVYQRPGAGERYEVQRLPPSRHATAVDVTLDDAEIAAKEHVRDAVYGTLMRQMGDLLRAVPRPHLAVEQIGPAETRLPAAGERAMRYEWRGELLHGRGEVGRVITYAEHYAPVAATLFGG